ncbi:hypothetical protein XFUD_11905 [Xylella fastidiosa]|uniref:Uncharacterized protein n=1 Tax=Xylella fastidiosa (strain 9a5c) TaxID=160492 RepID=Q9P9Y0_XYLFA|nr:hypothetical protein [Xylella fastidiosa]AAF85525.1 hypothetical protein XF_2740 [Xylella fastidiosa 9a5c]ALQ95718.1 hypothetical protein XFUD_11905 [Xylella fastidiosa]ALR09771.2 hypothetical protein XFFB_11905 [Xylella fastidiosa]WGZ32053.1 hypothetical protein O4444_11385 [Xylella fastidiosa subsp. pauca]WGZ34325.1 hypothetical protein O4445_11995 [Xylella fastidiosa subsp. pauca]
MTLDGCPCLHARYIHWHNAPLPQQSFERPPRIPDHQNQASIHASMHCTKTAVERRCPGAVKRLHPQQAPRKSTPHPPTLADGLVAAMRALQPGDVCNDQCNTWLPSHHTRTDAPSDLRHKPDPASDGNAVDLELLAMHHRRTAVLAVHGYCGPLASGLPGRTACCVSPRCGRASQCTPRGLMRTWDVPGMPIMAVYRPCVSYGGAATDDR